jgi:hypothetical protein
MGIEDLRVMIERASRYAERAVADSGGICTMWHAVTEDGRDVIMPPPHADKDVGAFLIRLVLKQLGAVRVVFIDECWTINIPATKENIARVERFMAEQGSMEDLEGREEVVAFNAEDVDGFALCGHRVIERHNGTMTLGPLIIEQPKYSEGRFVGMLEPRGTKQ